jgi:hypothetical protein
MSQEQPITPQTEHAYWWLPFEQEVELIMDNAGEATVQRMQLSGTSMRLKRDTMYEDLSSDP